LNEEQLQEAAAAIAQVVGFSAYLHAMQYDVDRFEQELHEAVDHMKAVPTGAR
jgi:hypothetical protein